MKSRRCILLTIVIWLTTQTTVWANNPPGPFEMLPEVAILPLMILLSWAGGFYEIRKQRGQVTKGMLARVLGVIVLIVLSGAHEGIGLILAVVFAVVALRRAITMINWGLKARLRPAPGEVEEVGPPRLIAAGGVLLAVTVFLGLMPIACFGYWQEESGFFQKLWLENYVEYQLGYAQCRKETTGQEVYDQRSMAEISDAARLPTFRGSDRANVEFGPDGKKFTAWMPPASEFRPFFPYNYLSKAPSWRADETGQIRMTRVVNVEPCPSDAPVVMAADPEAIQNWASKLASNAPIRGQ